MHWPDPIYGCKTFRFFFRSVDVYVYVCLYASLLRHILLALLFFFLFLVRCWVSLCLCVMFSDRHQSSYCASTKFLFDILSFEKGLHACITGFGTLFFSFIIIRSMLLWSIHTAPCTLINISHSHVLYFGERNALQYAMFTISCSVFIFF